MNWFKKANKDEIKTLFSHEWLTVLDNDGFVYASEPISESEGIVLLIFDNTGDELKVAGRFERCPAHGDTKPELYSLTGINEKEYTIKEIVVKEAKEEAGIDIKEKDLIELGQVRPWKGCDITHYLFAVDWSGKELGNPTGDGTKLEEDGYAKWVSLKDAINSQDPLLHSLILKLQNELV